MSYTPMSDLGQQGLFDITRTLLQQPDLASLCEALSQLVKRSALADNAAIVLWQAQTQRASYYASREKDTPIKYEDETVLAHGPVRSILSRPDTLHCSYEEFCETWPQLDAGGLYPKFGHYCLMPLAAEGHIFGGCEFIRYDDRPWSEKEFNRLQTFTQIVSVVTEQIQSRVVNNVDYELLCRERDNFRILVAITNAVLSRLDMDELVSEVAKEIHYYFDIDDIGVIHQMQGFSRAHPHAGRTLFIKATKVTFDGDRANTWHPVKQCADTRRSRRCRWRFRGIGVCRNIQRTAAGKFNCAKRAGDAAQLAAYAQAFIQLHGPIDAGDGVNRADHRAGCIFTVVTELRRRFFFIQHHSQARH